jgi:aspartate/methionine/tyrosine aminotransferase
LELLLGRTVDPDRELIVTPGTQGGLFAALSALVAPGDKVALPDPEYYMNEQILAYLGAVTARFALQQDAHGRLSLRAEHLKAAGSAQLRVLLLSHPNNPTGGVYEPTAAMALAQFAIDEDLLVIVDEMYCRMLFSGTTYIHLGSLPGMAERTVTLLGPSKTESMSGYRLGVAVGPPSAIDSMERILGLVSLRTSGYGQQALRHWMDSDEDWLKGVTEAHRELRDLIVERLEAIADVRVVSPAGSSYVFPLVEGRRWVRGNDGANDYEIAVALKAAGVLVVPGYRFGPGGRGRFRINFSQDRARLLTAAERIANVLA